MGVQERGDRCCSFVDGKIDRYDRESSYNIPLYNGIKEEAGGSSRCSVLSMRGRVELPEQENSIEQIFYSSKQ